MTTPKQPEQPQPTLRPPPRSPYDVQEALAKARKELEQAFFRFGDLLSDKTLPKNKSEAKKLHEHDIADKLYRAASELEMRNQGEGLMSLCIITLRYQLKMRDHINELEYQLKEAVRDMGKLGSQREKK